MSYTFRAFCAHLSTLARIGFAVALFFAYPLVGAGCGQRFANHAHEEGPRLCDGASLAQVLLRYPSAESKASQIVVVAGRSNASASEARFVCVGMFEPDAAGQLRCVLGPFPGVVGSNGIAPFGEKREGDVRTPGGRYTMTELFGDDAAFSTRMPYTVVTENDAWCEDPQSPRYNQWLHGDEAKSATDRLKRDDGLYRHAAVIDYNRWPAVPGAGSAIFLHKARPDGAGTHGCVGLDSIDLDAILLRLDPLRHPEIIIGVAGPGVAH